MKTIDYFTQCLGVTSILSNGWKSLSCLLADYINIIQGCGETKNMFNDKLGDLLSSRCASLTLQHRQKVETNVNIYIEKKVMAMFKGDSAYKTVTTMADISYFSSSVLLYIIFFHRIYKSFHHTMYEVSKQYLVFLSIMISIYAIFILIYVLLVATNQPAGIIYYAIFMVIEFIVSIALLVEFIFKLRQIILSQIDADLYQYVIEPTQNNADQDSIELGSTHTDNVSNISSDIELDIQQNTIITLITKITILSILAIIGVQIFWISVLIATATCDNELSQSGCDIDTVEPVLYGIRAVMLTINVIVLYLNFDFNASIYNKICTHWHMKCYRFCASKIKVAAQQRHHNLSDQTAENYRKL